ncbi:MAG: L,D-transpeptidase [Candidatus Promineifilaceae bacterium]|nr:L,D-transpeptidase [Candidatus Promineifilaceae bacterium]
MDTLYYTARIRRATPVAAVALAVALFFLFYVLPSPAHAATGATGTAVCEPDPRTGQYVCDARPQPQLFGQPDRPGYSLYRQTTYAWLDDGAPLYDKPGGEVAREATEGFLYYTLEESTTGPDGGTWYRVDDWYDGKPLYARAENMHRWGHSVATGITVHSLPERPFGWIVNGVRPSAAPAAEATDDAPYLTRYTFIQIYDYATDAEGWIWYDIGGGMWIKQIYVALADYSQRPPEIGEDEYWVEVDLFEQTFAAYEGDNMVYAGLVSSGLDRWPTNRGLFTVYARHLEWPMAGGDVGDDYYLLQDVPYTMFFDGDIALHGAYWHDNFGYKRSHGCVNMTPYDAEWVYNWSENAPGPLWVWVHATEGGLTPSS